MSNVLLSPNGYVFASPKPLGRFINSKSGGRKLFFSVVRASSDDADCNAEECAPEKEVLNPTSVFVSFSAQFCFFNKTHDDNFFAIGLFNIAGKYELVT